MGDEQTEDEKLTTEFEILAERAGLDIPPERRDGLFEQFKDFRRVLALLHRPRKAAVEPASTYRIETILRSL